jgi:hypothetical protein
MEITKDKITEIFCIIDDFCQEYDKEIARMSICEPDGRKHRNRKWTMSRSEIMTILIYFHFNTFRNFKHYYLFYVKVHLHDLFPKQLSYNRFVELESRVAVEMMLFLQLFCFGRCTGISFIDSTCIPVCHNKRITRNKVFRDYAERGKSTMGWYFGFKLHLICNERGELLNFMLTKANVDDRNTDVFNRLSDNVFGKLFADKGYISHGLFERLFNDGIEIVTGLKCNMKNKLMPLYDKILLRKRSVIETINDELKNVAQLVHSRHRSVFNFVMNVLSVLAAYSFFEKKPSINIDYCIENVDEYRHDFRPAHSPFPIADGRSILEVFRKTLPVVAPGFDYYRVHLTPFFINHVKLCQCRILAYSTVYGLEILQKLFLMLASYILD